MFKSSIILPPKRVERIWPEERHTPVIEGDIAFILLANNRGVVVVDAFNARLAESNWSRNGAGYASGCIPGVKGAKLMHRHLTNCPDELMVDHLNHDKLDNRMCNLRVCDRVENNRTSYKRKGCTSKYKGVHWYGITKKWYVRIMVDQKYICLGYYRDEEEAARVYDAKAFELGWPIYGLNFPEDYANREAD